MSTIPEIQQAILALPQDDYVRLRKWFGELDWNKWDEQIEADSKNGKLDFLVDQAMDAKANGTLLDL